MGALSFALSLNGAQGAITQPLLAHGQRLVYAALNNSVAVFTTGDTSPRQVGSITAGIGEPSGIFADSNQLYVANDNPVSVTIYTNGETQPNATLTDFPNPSYGLGAITAGPDGTIYFATSSGDDNGDQYVYEFAPGHSKPSLTLKIEAPGLPVYVAGLAVDGAKNLYVEQGTGTSCCGYGLEVFAPRHRNGQFIRFGSSPYGGDVITTPHGFIAVGVENNNLVSRIEVGQLPNPEKHLTGTLDLPGAAFALDPMFHLLYVLSHDGTLTIHRFITVSESARPAV